MTIEFCKIDVNKIVDIMATISLFVLVICVCAAVGSNQDVGVKRDDTSFEDARCKCVCPKYQKDSNSTLNEKTVYISSNVDPHNCKCEFVVNRTFELCSRCQCKFESRNTTTIKVVVIIIICIISLLLVYMLFLLCLDPLIARRPGQYQEHTNEDDQSVSQEPQYEHAAGSRPRLGRQRSVINYMSTEQKRWKSTVQEQRKNIYDKHTMLN